jgi:hypothetical protein
MREQPEVITSLLINHSANVFFEIRPLVCSANSARLGLVLRSEFAKASHITSALGCALDCLASITGHQVLGDCAAAESEVNFHHEPLLADLPREFVAEASLDLVENSLALFTSSIYTPDNQLVANACGTLKRLRPRKQHTNNLVVMADWRELQGACAH